MSEGSTVGGNPEKAVEKSKKLIHNTPCKWSEKTFSKFVKAMEFDPSLEVELLTGKGTALAPPPGKMSLYWAHFALCGFRLPATKFQVDTFVKHGVHVTQGFVIKNLSFVFRLFDILKAAAAVCEKIRTTENMAGEEAVVPVETPAPALGEPMDIMTALQLVLRKSLAHGGLVRGLHEAAKVIEKHAALLCVLAEDCNQPDYQKLVKALCADHNVSLVTVPAAKTLGEWAGLCKIDSEGKARKVVGCSCLVVKDYGEESEGLHIVQEYVKSH
ncbi:hypothetical protein M8C21_011189 [Ambrosia artemisiifolia]|nr:hypothetical protein M8C21_011189 [Ambrosia artemisiifolia]